MPARRTAIRPAYTEAVIRRLATANNVVVVVSSNDTFAQHVTRLSGDNVTFDPIENTIVALQRKFLSRTQAVCAPGLDTRLFFQPAIFDPRRFRKTGYLRNVARAKDPDIVQRLQHNTFLTGIDAALAHLEDQPTLAYRDVLHTHETLFQGVDPWAGEDRLTNAPDLFIKKGTVLFAHPQDIRKAVDYALQKGQDKVFMREKPGEACCVMDIPLDGNDRIKLGRHAAHSPGADCIDWNPSFDKCGLKLSALTAELEEPGKGNLDQYLKPFIRDDSMGSVAETIKAAPGLDGNNADAVAGSTDDPALKAQYETQALDRASRRETVSHATRAMKVWVVVLALVFVT